MADATIKTNSAFCYIEPTTKDGIVHRALIMHVDNGTPAQEKAWSSASIQYAGGFLPDVLIEATARNCTLHDLEGGHTAVEVGSKIQQRELQKRVKAVSDTVAPK